MDDVEQTKAHLATLRARKFKANAQMPIHQTPVKMIPSVKKMKIKSSEILSVSSNK